MCDENWMSGKQMLRDQLERLGLERVALALG